MSFAQTSSAEGVPAALQNGYATLHVIDAVAGAAITNVAFVQTKSLAIVPPAGRYHAIGSLTLQCSAAAGNWVAVQLQADANIVQQYGMMIPPAGYIELPVSFPLPVSAATSISVLVASQSGSVQYQGCDILFIRA